MNIACPECTTVYRVDPDRIPADGVAASCRECGTAFLVDDTLGPTAPGGTVVAPRLEGAGGTDPADAAGPEAEGYSEAAEPEAAEGTEAAAGSADGTEAAEAEDETEAVEAADEPEAGEVAAAVQGSETIQTPGHGEESEAAEEAELVDEPRAVEETGAVDEAAVVDRSGADEGAAEDAGPVGGSETEESESAPEDAPAFGPQDPNTRARRLARALVSDIKVYHPDKWEEARAKGTLRADFRDEILKSWDEYVEQVGETMAKSTPFFRDALNEILAQGEHVF